MRLSYRRCHRAVHEAVGSGAGQDRRVQTLRHQVVAGEVFNQRFRHFQQLVVVRLDVTRRHRRPVKTARHDSVGGGRPVVTAESAD